MPHLHLDLYLSPDAEARRRFGRAVVARKAVYVIYTEHDGDHFQLEEKVLPSRTPGEDPLAE